MSDTKLHPLRVERKRRNLTQQQLADLAGLAKITIERAERGEPVRADSRHLLCAYLNKSAQELGLVCEEREEVVTEPLHVPAPLPVPVATRIEWEPSGASKRLRTIDLLSEVPGVAPEQQLGAWLVLSANDLTPLFDAGWTLDSLLKSLQIVLQGVHAMPMVTRRQLLQLGAAAMISGIPFSAGESVSYEERARLCQALGQSIAASWKLFHTTSTAQVLAVGQAQLYLLQQTSPHLYSSVRPMLYSGVYRLIGAALHFQGRYQEAYQAHERAYYTALEAADVWNMAQSRGWQAYGLKALGRYYDALQMADAALRLVSIQDDKESIRLRARLLAFSAENAALLDNAEEVQARLDASEGLLELLPGYHEEFDRASWLQQAGMCALSLGQYEVAATRLQNALDELPGQWTLRYVSTALPLASAFARMKEQGRALAIVEQTLPTVKLLQSPALTQEFTDCLQSELLRNFPQEQRCLAFVSEAQRQLALA